MTIHPGDSMYADIHNLGGGQWSIYIKDLTTGQSFTTQQAYSGPQTSAEWIQEAPTVNGQVATLAHYGATKFDPGTVNGGNPGLVSSDEGVMIQNGSQVSTPSNPDGDTDGFNVQYGSTQPAPPAS
jgi:Peptidase A4 family